MSAAAVHVVRMDARETATTFDVSEHVAAVAGDWYGNCGWVGQAIPAIARVEPDARTLVTLGNREFYGWVTSVALTHAQFETIHPYTDGNGCSGRALAQSILRFRGITRNVAMPVSAGLLAVTVNDG